MEYNLAGKLGEGGTGKAWRALDATFGRDVAVNVLPDGIAEDTRRSYGVLRVSPS